jgi:DNA-directed RNA polymerase subunit K/omega
MCQRRSLLPWVLAYCSFGDATRRFIMVRRTEAMNTFEFVVLSALRAAQLQRGCTPRVEQSAKKAVTAQREVAEGKVLAVRAAADPVAPTEPVALAAE